VARYKEAAAALEDKMYRRASKGSFMEAWSRDSSRRRRGLFWRHPFECRSIMISVGQRLSGAVPQIGGCFALRPKLDDERRLTAMSGIPLDCRTG